MAFDPSVVDNSNKLKLTLDSGAFEYKTAITDKTVTSQGNGNTDRTWRAIIDSSVIIQAGTHIKLKVGYAGAWSFDKCYIGQRDGDTGNDFLTTPTQVTFEGGNPGASPTADLESDAIEFTFDPDLDLVVSFHCTSIGLPYGTNTGCSGAYWPGDSAADQTVIGGTPTAYITGFKGLSVLLGDLTDFPLTVHLDGTDPLHAAVFDELAPIGPDTNTVFLLESDTTDESTTFTDLANGHAITPSSAPKHDSGQNKFSKTALYFDGTDDYLYAADHADFELGSNDFTARAWIYLNGYAGNNNGIYNMSILTKDVNGGRSFSLQINGTASSIDGIGFTGFWNNTTGYLSLSETAAMNLNTWYHIEVCRVASVLYFFLDGVCLNPGGTAFAVTVQNTGTSLKVGANVYGSGYNYYFNGYMQGVELINGTGLHTDDFTLPNRLFSTPAKKRISIEQGTTQLPVEIENWDQTSEKAFLHTKVPTYSSTTDTELILSFDSSQDDNVEYVGETGTVESRKPVSITTNYLGTNASSARYVYGAGIFEGRYHKLKLRRLSYDYVITEIWIGHQADTGDTWDMAGDQVQITFRGGDTSVTVDSDEFLTDLIDFEVDPTKDIVISLYTTTGDAPYVTSIPSNCSRYAKDNVNEAADSDVTGYTVGSAWSFFMDVLKISPSQAVWDDNFVAVYHMAQAPTGLVLDSTGNGYDLTSYGSMTADDLADTAYGKGIQFDGSNDYLQRATLTEATTAISVEALFNTPAGSTQIGLAGDYNGSSRGWIFLMDANGYMNMDGRTGGGYASAQSTSAYDDGAYHYACGHLDGADLKLWMDDGTDTATAAVGAGSIAGGSILSIGGYALGGGAATTFWKDYLNEFRVSDIVRSDDWKALTNLSLTDALITWAAIAEEGGGNPYQFDLTIAAQGETLTDFPVTVVLGGGSGITSFDTSAVFDTFTIGQLKYADTDPVIHYTMDDITGSIVADEIGTTDGTITGFTQTVGGFFDNYLAGGSIASVSHTVDFGSDTAFKSISMWIRLTNTTSYHDWLCNSAVNRSMYCETNGDLYFWSGSATAIGGLSITDTDWHHICVVEGSNSNNHWVYLDGVKCSAEISSNAGGLYRYFGRVAIAGHYAPDLTNCQIYDYALTDAEITALYEYEPWKKLIIKQGDTVLPVEVEDWDATTATLHTKATLDTSETVLTCNFDPSNADNDGFGEDDKNILLIHSDDTDDSTTFVDSSDNALTLTPAGTPVHSTDWSKFGASSLYFDGSSSLSIADSSLWAFGSGDFCVELWVNLSSIVAWTGFIGQWPGTTNRAWNLCVNGSSNIELSYTNNSTTHLTNLATTYAPTAGVPFHVCVECYNGTTTIYINGASVDSHAIGSIYDSTAIISIGSFVGNTKGITGYIDELRVSSVARYKGNFTPATKAFSTPGVGETGSEPAKAVWDDNFQAVYHFAQDPSGGFILDSTTNEHISTVYGSMTSADLVDGLTGKALEFDGVDDYIGLGSELVVASTATVDILHNIPASATTDWETIFEQRSTLTSGGRWLSITSAYVGIYSGGIAYDNGGAFKVVSATKNGVNAEAFLDGSSLGTYGTLDATYTPNYPALISARRQDTGLLDGDDYTPGKIDELRISNIVRSDAWIDATNASLTDALITFTQTTTGEEEPPPVELTAYRAYVDQYFDLEMSILRAILEQEFYYYSSFLNTSVQSYGLRLANLMTQYWGNAPQLRAKMVQALNDSPELRRAFIQKYGHPLDLRMVFEQGYNMAPALLNILEQRYHVTEEQLVGVLEQGFIMSEFNFHRTRLEQVYMTAADTLELQHALSVTIGGSRVYPSHINIEGNRSVYCMTAEIHLSGQAEFVQTSKGQEMIIEHNGNSFHFITEMPRRSRRNPDAKYIVPAASKAILLDEPYAELLNQEFSAGMAKDIAESLVAPYGITLDWQILNWPIPADTLYANNEVPLKVLKKITGAVGAILQSTPDGTLKVIPGYPVSVNRWDAVTPDIYLTDQDNFYTTEETPQERKGYNRFVISDQLSANDNLWLEENAISGTEKEIKGFMVPWDAARQITLETSGGSWVRIEPMGMVEETLIEQVQIVDGNGRTNKPIYEMVDREWNYTSLGYLNFNENGDVFSEIEGDSLVQVTYKTRYYKWVATNNNNEDVQFILDTVEV